MKKLITYFSIGILSALTFVSCGTGKSLTQKHYNNRYYIGMSKKESAKDEVTNESQKIDKDKTFEIENSILAAEEQGVPVAVPVENPTQNITRNTDEIQSNEIKQNGKSFKKTAIEETKINHYLISPIKHAIGKRVVLKSPPATSDDALSLLWIVIVVLLILWAIGFIADGFGLGGLIHILLVIALILLILWLLRII